MFGKKKSEEIKVFAEQAKEDRKFFAEQLQKEREYVTEQLALLYTPDSIAQNEAEKEINDIDKKKAAYALNMCTVSVSQIIDYNDIYVLEQEYEAILNNLNLEKIIKDEALLNTLKLLLDTITFFRIQEKEKEFVEKEYQNKLKNAIWSSIPNPSVILATGNPYAMVAALATQVGIGYMNYRKNRNNARMEKDQRNWELQKSAIEQFNGIRRELFDASWRLAAKYQFPEEYRLTERQIKQYDHILMDTNYIRKYERLVSIADNFKAYPYFWYYLGNAANIISADSSLNISAEDREKYQLLAIEHFSKFDECDNIGILREDLIASSCYIEYAEVLMARNEDKGKINSLIKKAISKCGGDCDVLQICAMTYLKIGAIEEAKPIFKQLIVEDYNQKANSQLLSCIYVSEALVNNGSTRFEYNSLKLLVSPNQNYLLEMPSAQKLLESRNNAVYEFNALRTDYIRKQQDILFDEWQTAITNYLKKFSEKFDSCIPKKNTFKKDKSINNVDEFIRLSEEIGFPDNIINLFNDMVDGISELGLGKEASALLSNSFYSVEGSEKTALEVLTEQIYGESHNIDTIKKKLSEVTFSKFTDDYIEQLNNEFKNAVALIKDFSDLSKWETALFEFCRKNSIVLSKKYSDYSSSEKTFHSLIDSIESKEKIEKKKNLKRIIKDLAHGVIKTDTFDMLIYGEDTAVDHKINSYEIAKLKYDVNHLGFGGTELESNNVLAVLDNNGNDVMTKQKENILDGLIFTTKGIGRIKGKPDRNVGIIKEARKSVVPYSEIKYEHGSLTIKGDKYKAEQYLDLNSLYDLIQRIQSEL